MYTSAYRLTREPFGIAPDPTLLFLTRTHREILAGLRYAILAEKGFTLLTGDAGTGKTTVISALMRSLPSNLRIILILNPGMEADEFLEYLILQLGVKDVPVSKARRMAIIQDLLQQTEAGTPGPVLIIDEAHRLTADVLEEIRLLGNFEGPDRKRLQIVLAGQTELCDVLNQTNLRQLKQRIAVRLSLDVLTPAETAEYIAFRWQMSGAAASHPFSPQSLAAIARYAKGIPRVVNAICDNALVMMLAEEKPVADEMLIREVCSDLDLLEASSGSFGQLPVSGPDASLSPLTEPAPASAGTPVVGPSSTQAAQESISVTAAAAAPFQTLQRYEISARQSFLMRCAAKLGFVQ